MRPPDSAIDQRLGRRFASLALVAACGFALAGCSRGPDGDPCNQTTFSDSSCQVAVRRHGYFYYGAWYPMAYAYPYSHYYGGYRTYVAGGGTVRSPGASVYSPSYSGSHPSSGSGTVRGIGGSIGAAHASRSGGA